ncbi:MAG: hypothetical protein IJ062_05250 [Firmicutes bacterium]|nr:hypothetical protein [Bacillota bacterium]
MTKAENHLIKIIKENINILFFAIISVLGLAVRIYGLGYMSGDMLYCLIPWFDEIKAGGGIASLSAQVGNYSLLYQTIIALMTYTGLPCIVLYKSVSIVFDYLLAYAAAALVCEYKGKPKMSPLFCGIYALILFLPTVIMNSAYWGQCDSIYTFFLVLTLKNMYNKKYPAAFIYYGLAFSFKLQSVFILPFIICLYFARKDFSMLYGALSFAVFMLSGTAAYLNGRSLLAPFTIYVGQTNDFGFLQFNFPSFWTLIGSMNVICFKYLSILMTVAVCGMGMYAVISGKNRIGTAEGFYGTAVWFIWSILLFLPSMHERYAYPLDIMLICLSFFNVKYIKYAVLSAAYSVLTYGVSIILTAQDFSLTPNLTYNHALISVLAWVFFTYEILNAKTNDQHKSR